MQQRQLRLGDILDDYCPRERRVTNHAVVAMVGDDVKQTRCTTCDAEHEYKHAKVPRQRRKPATPAALYSQVLANAPKRVVHEAPTEAAEPSEEEAPSNGSTPSSQPLAAASRPAEERAAAEVIESEPHGGEEEEPAGDLEEGPVHRPLIRATLPRPEGQPPAVRPAPEFTIRQPGGRPSRFRPRHQRQQQQFRGSRSNGNVTGGRPPSGGMPRHGGRPPVPSRLAKRQPGRKRSK